MPALAAAAPDPRIAAAARGDRRAAEALCRELLPRVRNLVRYLLRGLATFRGDGRFESWVDRVVARVAFTAIRRIRAETQPGLHAPVEGEADGAAAAAGDSYALRRELAEALDRLPGDQRESLVLHFAIGMTVQEIAEATAAPVETVRSRLRLGKAALRQALGGRDGRAI